jgi:hypothetical protein
MEMPQGNYLCSYLKQNFFSFFLLLICAYNVWVISPPFPLPPQIFSFTKSENGRAKQVLPGGLVPVEGGGGGERAWDGEYNANTVYT